MNPFTVARPNETFAVAIDGIGKTSVSLVP